MLEFIAIATFVGYLIYLRYYADQRTPAQLEADRLREGITLYDTEQYGPALAYFNEQLRLHPKSAVAYLYRARIYRSLGDPKAALSDLNQAKSFDDTIAELHLELGQIHYDEDAYSTAFQDFDKAIFHDHGDTPAPYHWRGLTRQQLGQYSEAEQDLNRAEQLAQQRLHTEKPTQLTPEPIFLSRQLLQHAVLALFSGCVLLYIIRLTPLIHWPLFWAAASSVGLGFLEPRKGWVLALVQLAVLFVGYYLVLGPNPVNSRQEVDVFSLFGSAGLTLVGSFIGAVLQRAQAR